ncbi:phage integrase SAM-like domain-containing protein [Olivibacter sp. SDN3]|uniref:phage integrase SAM-like domain-containing protein n=1 Tax=Olivibacter sp. SDN3 TaxID=2764720 RepID=UPI0016515F60|nr:phage integrase SAM-like domain-containing protein [Olivibacter sp. SDN3]QNL50347.1 phage integrase SAM-like domain-containing protein [Olivibacter sp. SDN3]
MSRTVKIECGISFRLRETGATKPTPITCFVEYNGKPVVKIPTGTKVHPAKWNPEKERPIGGLKGLDSAEAKAIIEKLATVKATVETEYRTFVNKFQSYPDKAIFKEQVIGLLAGATTVKASDPSQSLLSFFDRQVKLSREGKRTVLKGKRAGMRYRENTIRSYEGSRTLLQEYVEHRKLKRLNFDNVTMDFYYDLRNYMFTDRSFSLNYFGKVIKHVKLFMGEAKELGWHANEIYKSKAFIKVEEETDAVYNDIEQLGAIHSVDLTGHPGLKNARDLYLLGAWSGLRFQDYSVLAEKARVHGDFIHIETEKTGVFVAIPILPVTREILESYRQEDGTYLYPKPISNQKLNDYIKIIGKMAGLTQPVSITVPQGGTRVQVTIPFYDAMGTHTARRSFATNMYKHYRLPTFTIMKITGHTTETNFFKYIKMTREENAQLILDTVTAKIELEKAG